jgi:hypothetical protein
VLLDRAAAGDIDEIAHGRVLPAGVADHPVAEPLEREFGQFLVGERRVDRLFGKIVVQHFGEDERVHLARRRLDDGALFLCCRRGFAKAHIAGRGDAHALGVTAPSGNGGLEGGVFPHPVGQ